jgi:catechol 2,3-dioxygenase-like lactoylglutathione lyase family enzyme
MLLGLASAIYPVADLSAAKAWYARVLGEQPYFDQPFYVGFSVGGFELGLYPQGTPGTAGVLAYWRVPDAASEFQRLLDLGATSFEPVKDVGEGIKVASVVDPFGNVLSIIENPHFGG